MKISPPTCLISGTTFSRYTWPGVGTRRVETGYWFSTESKFPSTVCSVNKERKGTLIHHCLTLQIINNTTQFWGVSHDDDDDIHPCVAHLPGLEFCRFWCGCFHRGWDNGRLHCLLLGLLWPGHAKRRQRIDPIPTCGQEQLECISRHVQWRCRLISYNGSSNSGTNHRFILTRSF